MPKFCANLTTLFNEVEFMERFELASKVGFEGVEYLFPYAYDKEELVEQLDRYGLVQVLHNLPAGDWEAGERGIACHPDRVGEFQDGVGQAIEYATMLDCKKVNCLAGTTPEGVDADKVRSTFIENLSFAADKLSDAGIKLLIEPINTRDFPGFYLSNTSQAMDIIKAVDSPNLGLLYDVYHMQIMEGDLAKTIARVLSKLEHVQIADNPGRHEPGTGEIYFPFLLAFIDYLDYQGWIGCEYKPDGNTVKGLKWIKPFWQMENGNRQNAY